MRPLPLSARWAGSPRFASVGCCLAFFSSGLPVVILPRVSFFRLDVLFFLRAFLLLLGGFFWLRFFLVLGRLSFLLVLLVVLVLQCVHRSSGSEHQSQNCCVDYSC